MDRHSGCTAAKDTGVEGHVLAKKALRFLALVSFFSFLYSYFLGFSSYNVQFSTLIFSVFAHSLDRKFMFLICNGIIAFLVKNLSLSSSAGFIKNVAEDGDKQISELPATLVQENVASVEYDISAVAEEEETEECTYRAVSEPAEDQLEEYEVSEPAEDQLEEDEEDEEDEIEAKKGEEGTLTVDEVSDAIVSTEELNHKCEEFIRKMKKEIRVEAQKQPVTV